MNAPHVPPGYKAFRYSRAVLERAYRAAADIHLQAGQAHVTMLVLAAFIIRTQSHLARCSTDETLELVRNYLRDLPE